MHKPASAGFLFKYSARELPVSKKENEYTAIIECETCHAKGKATFLETINPVYHGGHPDKPIQIPGGFRIDANSPKGYVCDVCEPLNSN